MAGPHHPNGLSGDDRDVGECLHQWARAVQQLSTSTERVSLRGVLEQTQCCAFSADEGADVGADEGTQVTEAYQVPFRFNGKIDSVTIELKEMTQSAARRRTKPASRQH